MQGWRKMQVMLSTLAIIVGSAVVAGCADDSQSGGLLIGVALPLSGNYAAWGQAQRDAIDRMASRHQLDETRTRIVYRDDQNQPGRAAEITSRFLKDGRVSAVIGGTTAESAAAVTQAARGTGKPVMLLALDADPIDATTTPNVFGIAPAVDVVADTLLARLRQTGAKRISVLAADDPFGQSGADELDGKSSDFGITVVDRQKFSLGGDIAQPARAATDDGADALLVFSRQPAAAAVMQAVKSTNFSGRVFVAPGASAETLAGEPAADGAFLAYPSLMVAGNAPATSLDSLRQKRFFAQYVNRYGPALVSAASAVDGVGIFATAADLATATGPRQIRHELQDFSYSGLLGSYGFAELRHNGLSRSSLVVAALRNRAWFL